MTVIKGIDRNAILAGRRNYWTKQEKLAEKKLVFVSLVYRGVKVYELHADKNGIGWVWNKTQGEFIKASIYLPLMNLLHQEDGNV